ncbi:hypothetical protein RBSH_04146 [Rhodopirellula baltica SH28]|uniref:Uncharacterized protein n=1 Tax=Rhodopirellula baltica SH28 TaxID=993517 RepID=K5DC70_RHOBT|nr:hypothetical protein RBSH_04146 [Rhodopirellula baltica SH28]
MYTESPESFSGWNHIPLLDLIVGSTKSFGSETLCRQWESTS